jgi:hypothetical protein
MYDCTKCGYTLGPFSQNGEAEIQVGACPQCQSKGPFQVSSPYCLKWLYIVNCRLQAISSSCCGGPGCSLL